MHLKSELSLSTLIDSSTLFGIFKDVYDKINQILVDSVGGMIDDSSVISSSSFESKVVFNF